MSCVFYGENTLDKSLFSGICWKNTHGIKDLKTRFSLRTMGILERILSGRAGKRSWK